MTNFEFKVIKMNIKLILSLTLITSLLFNTSFCQSVGVQFNSEEAHQGYTLFAGGPSNGGGGGPGGGGGGNRGVYLINNCGELVNSWLSTNAQGLSCKLDYEGNLLRAIVFGGNSSLDVGGGGGGGIEKLDWQGNQIWEYNANQSDFFQHHDVAPLPNGNVLAITWEFRPSSEAINAGRSSGQAMNPCRIIEVEPSGTNGGNVVWQWQAFDHLIQDANAFADNFGVVEDNPQRFDVNSGANGNDWMHCNSIDYLEEFDLILVSSKYFNEIFVIDHSTTIA